MKRKLRILLLLPVICLFAVVCINIVLEDKIPSMLLRFIVCWVFVCISVVPVFLWRRKIMQNQAFYKEVFGIVIDVEKPIPSAPLFGFSGLLYIPGIKPSLAIEAYKKLFGEDSFCVDHDNVNSRIEKQQSRPKGEYWIRHRNGNECDRVHRDKSYDDFYGNKKDYMILVEGILFALYHRWQTKKVIDQICKTRFHTLYYGGDVPLMYGDGYSRLRLEEGFTRSCDSDSGPREIFLKK